MVNCQSESILRCRPDLHVKKRAETNMVTNRVMPRALFCLRDIHATWVADGTHQNPHWHLNIYPAVPPRLAALGRRNVSSDCSQEVTACFTSASVANRLSVGCVLRDPKKWKFLAPYVYGAAAWRLLSAFHTALNSRPVISISDSQFLAF